MYIFYIPETKHQLAGEPTQAASHTGSATQPDLKQDILSSLFLSDNTTYRHAYSFRKHMSCTNARCTQKFASTCTTVTHQGQSSTLEKQTQTPIHAEKLHTESAAQPDLKQQILSSLFLRDDTTYTVHKYSFGKLMRSTNARYT